MEVKVEEISLPGGQILAKDEKLLKRRKFMSSLMTFYIKSDFAITNKRFIAHYPKIVLGILPLGFNNLTFSLKQISNVSIDVSYKIFKILIGIIAIIIGLNSGSTSIMLISIIVGVFFFLSGVQVYIKVATSGGTTSCPIILFEKGKAEKLIQEVNMAIAENS